MHNHVAALQKQNAFYPNMMQILEAKPNLDQTITKIITSKGARIDRGFQDQAHFSMIYYAKLIGSSRNVVIIYMDGNKNTDNR